MSSHPAAGARARDQRPAPYGTSSPDLSASAVAGDQRLPGGGARPGLRPGAPRAGHRDDHPGGDDDPPQRDLLALPGRRTAPPGAWDRFGGALPGHELDGDLLAAYARLMGNPDRAVREKAAADWLAWEDAVISDEPTAPQGRTAIRRPTRRSRSCASAHTSSATAHGWRRISCCATPANWPGSRRCWPTAGTMTPPCRGTRTGQSGRHCARRIRAIERYGFGVRFAYPLEH